MFFSLLYSTAGAPTNPTAGAPTNPTEGPPTNPTEGPPTNPTEAPSNNPAEPPTNSSASTNPTAEPPTNPTEGPPINFILESRTEESLSFSWGIPAAPIPTGYHLECLAMVSGVTNPPPVETTERSATLSSLSPGVLYICTLNALTGSHRSPSTTISATTLESGATYGSYILLIYFSRASLNRQEAIPMALAVPWPEFSSVLLRLENM